MKWCYSIFLVAFLLFPVVVLATTDLGIGELDVKFSIAKPLAGQEVRIYATVHNYEQQDARAKVRFLVNGQQIGNTQPLTVIVGAKSTVFVDWQPQEGYYNIVAEVIDIDPADGASNNDRVEIKEFLVDLDTDNDGVHDTADLDDDNDGIDDGVERINGTNPLKSDTDNDGFNDKEDASPNDPDEHSDFDKDGIGDNQDPDDDNDGVLDAAKKEQVAGQSANDMTNLLPAEIIQAAPPSPLKVLDASQEEGYGLEKVDYTFPDQLEGELGAMIAKNRIGWNKWVFDVLGAGSDLNYLWDFGDGSTSNGKSPEHAFPGRGQYKITLAVSNGQDAVGQAQDFIKIGFWHLGNPWLQIILGVAGLFVISLLIIIFTPAKNSMKVKL